VLYHLSYLGSAHILGAGYNDVKNDVQSKKLPILRGYCPTCTFTIMTSYYFRHGFTHILPATTLANWTSCAIAENHDFTVSFTHRAKYFFWNDISFFYFPFAITVSTTPVHIFSTHCSIPLLS
jgi:hypothetical protein